ncbi:PAS domain S-box protein [Azospirillum rugosum]|uniref:histidine kinase n=1 Tax=Azospirillum rugosum TaxID=416170 RepID=A0ABS4SYJ8_9PROT|nr:PAS domain S-box protein [Azospirillum rugosum]MBP2297067.1 PAS domain S-box-containing protein [Azospirillum rugosum]MDQ0530861.1 PAS domain S-box-containing protein [Azospirillum rugosum]
MNRSDARLDKRVLVLAPQGRDSALLCESLNQAGIEAVPCTGIGTLCERMAEGASAAVITEEALRPGLNQLVATLNSQPAWSDFPLVLLTESRDVTPALSPTDELWWKATILPRPISPETLLSVIRVALRSRQRQYQLRDHIAADRQRMVEILEGIGDGFVSLTRDGRCAYVNSTLVTMYGVAREALLGRMIWEALPGWDHEPIRAQLMRALDSHHTLDFDIRRPQAWHEVRCSPSADGLSIFINDVTARKEAEHTKQEQDAKYRAIVETAVDPTVVIDETGLIQSFNRAAEAAFGWKADEVIERNVSLLMPEPYRSAHDGYLARYVRTGEARIIGLGREVLGQRRDGSTFPLHLSVAAWQAGGKRYFTGIMRDITESKKAEQAILAARDEAERANLAKSRFLAAASHDLRQPAQSLVFLVAALAGKLRDHPALPVVERINDSLDALRMLLDGILDISKLDAGVVVPEVVEFPIGSILRRLGDEYRLQAVQRRLDIRVVWSGAHVRSDPALLERILRNLIENALRYTQQGRIVVGCRRRGKDVRIIVADTGIGIPADQLGLIFEEFHQVGNPERDRSQGLGLGLAIVRRLSSMLGHKVQVHSVLGRGSCFALTVPLGGAPKPLVLPIEPDMAPDTWMPIRRALVIDDEEIVRTSLAMMLEDWRFEVIAAGSGEEAVDAVTRSDRPPDIIIADYRLRAGHTGIEAARDVQKALAGC